MYSCVLGYSHKTIVFGVFFKFGFLCGSQKIATYSKLYVLVIFSLEFQNDTLFFVNDFKITIISPITKQMEYMEQNGERLRHRSMR